jgi:hypothetical protein
VADKKDELVLCLMNLVCRGNLLTYKLANGNKVEQVIFVGSGSHADLYE